MTRVLILASSPRKNGNSDKLAEAFAKGAKSVGHEVNTLYIREMQINGCIGCEYCYEHEGECAQKDDMQKVYKMLENTDILVFATPIYYQAFPAQLKAVVDRLYVTENRTFPIKGTVLLATYASKGKEMSEMTIKYYKTLIDYHEWSDYGILAVDKLDEIDDIQDNEALLIACEMAKNL